MIVNHIREYKRNHTQGKIYINGAFFCYCLENIGRPAGVKIPRSTCLPEGCYDIEITHSNKFNCDMIILFNTPDLMIRKGGVVFSGTRVHGGNDTDDTDGCPLVAYKENFKNGKIWGAADRDLRGRVRNLKLKKWIISS